MNKYDIRDFNQYWMNTYIRLPGGAVGRVVNAAAPDVITVQVSGTDSIFRLNQLEWEHVRLPRLGYRNCNRNGRGLYYFTRVVARQATKGLSHNTVKCDLVPSFYDALSKIRANASHYYDSAVVNDAAVQELYKPTFVSLEEAVKLISSRKEDVGYAIDYDFAVTLGPTKASAFVLLWKQLTVAESEDGYSWNLKADEYKDIIDRHFKDFKYA